MITNILTAASARCLSASARFFSATRRGTQMATHAAAALVLTLFGSCAIEPPLHLHEDIDVPLPLIDLELRTLWDYDLYYNGERYDCESYWLYGWDEEDTQRFGKIGYREPNIFNIRRYYNGWRKGVAHSSVLADQVEGTLFTGEYNFGFYDLLVFNEVEETDGAQNIHIDEHDLDNTIAFTNQTMHSTPHHSPKYSNSVNQPEGLFAVYQRDIEIPDPAQDYVAHGFHWDNVRNRWVKTLTATLEPVVYIYLTQIILVNNHGRVAGVDGSADLSGMAHDVNLNTRINGIDPVSVYYGVRMKDYNHYHLTYTGPTTGDLITYVSDNPVSELVNEPVDIIGGKVMTFGMCSLDPASFPSRVGYAESVKRIEELDPAHHYVDVNLVFNNGINKTCSFDVTNQVRRLYKGGVLTIIVDVDKIYTTNGNGAGFDAEIVPMDSVVVPDIPL